MINVAVEGESDRGAAEAVARAAGHAVNIMRVSRGKARLDSLIPKYNMVINGTSIGPLYVKRINDFASDSWSVSKAADLSESLRRAVTRIGEIRTIA